MDVESLPGESLPAGTFTAERWMTFLWADATQNDVDAYRYADATDEPATLIPPAFGTTLAIDSAGGIDSMLDVLEIPDEKDVFHGEQRMEILTPLRVGETYAVAAEIAEVETKDGRRDEFHVITINYLVTRDDDLVMELEIGVVVR